jgi:hypothetical protein
VGNTTLGTFTLTSALKDAGDIINYVANTTSSNYQTPVIRANSQAIKVTVAGIKSSTACSFHITLTCDPYNMVQS